MLCIWFFPFKMWLQNIMHFKPYCWYYRRQKGYTWKTRLESVKTCSKNTINWEQSHIISKYELNINETSTIQKQNRHRKDHILNVKCRYNKYDIYFKPFVSRLQKIYGNGFNSLGNACAINTNFVKDRRKVLKGHPI